MGLLTFSATRMGCIMNCELAFNVMCGKILSRRGFFLSFFVYFCSENKNKTTDKTIMNMKKILLPVITALFMGMASSSCSKDYIESTNTVWELFTVTNNRWDIDDETGDLVCSLKWPIIDAEILASGNVMAYFLEDGRQVPLPYVQRHGYINPITGAADYVPLNIRFDIEPGVITFVVADLSQYHISQYDLLTMEFRAVCTYPVVYRI